LPVARQMDNAKPVLWWQVFFVFFMAINKASIVYLFDAFKLFSEKIGWNRKEKPVFTAPAFTSNHRRGII
jgi:hypothetical protein